MTRIEEATNKILEFIDIVKDVPKNESILAIGLDMVEWADKTMLDKVYKVIKEMLPNYVELNYVFDEISVNYHKFENNFISDLKKAVEE